MFKDLSLSKNRFFTAIGLTLGIGTMFFTTQVLALSLVLIILRLRGDTGEQIKILLQENVAVQLLLVSLVATISVYFVFRILKFIKAKPLKFLLLSKAPTPRQLGDVVLTYGLYFLTLLAAVVLINVINEIYPLVNTEQAQDLGIGAVQGWGLVAAFLMLVIIPPIYEEILFRGFLYNILKKHSNWLVAGVLTSILFGIAHLEYDNLNWIAAIDTLIFSGFLIYVSQKHQSLYSSMFLHAIKNSIAFYVLFLNGQLVNFQSLYYFVLIAPLLFAIIFLARYSNRAKNK